MSNETHTITNTYLTFRLGKEYFASNVSKVLNILEMLPITHIPKAPDYMKGVINLRGLVLPVIDTRIKFGMTPTEMSPSTGILVLDIHVNGVAAKLGAIVDSVDEVIELGEADIQEPPSIGTKYKSEFIEGMAKKDQGFIMILNMDKVFSADEILEVEHFHSENLTT
ncbi:MAG: chemotaxis protein CheW [Salinivirgaceae bacterium]|jgi:purine-binding chemotaxis protein CheW